MSRRLGEILVWITVAATLTVAFRSGATSGGWVVAVIASVLLATVVVVFWRAFSTLSRLQNLLMEGRPDPMLRIIGRRLRYRGGGRARGQLLIYQAGALSMKGEWDKGLVVLDGIDLEADLEALDPEQRPAWELAYHSTRFSCLIFSEEIEQARELFDRELAPLADNPAAELAVRAMEAELWFCEGAHGRAERVFEDIVGDYRMPPSSRAVFHYFLGRIYRTRGDRDASDEQFELARELGGKTWIADGIDALEREAEEAIAAFKR